MYSFVSIEAFRMAARLTRSAAFGFVLLSPIVAGAGGDESGTGAPASTGALVTGAVCVEGALTDEGVECPAFRARDGTLYTLTGDLGVLEPGQPACVCGEAAMISFCMQGTTLAVTRVGPPDDC